MPSNALLDLMTSRAHYNAIAHTSGKVAFGHIPTNTKHLYTICTTSAQRLRRWSTIVHMLCFVFAGYMCTTNREARTLYLGKQHNHATARSGRFQV